MFKYQCAVHSNWVAQGLKGQAFRGRDVQSSSEREELARLRRVNRHRMLERAFLGNATAWVRGQGDKTAHWVDKLVNPNHTEPPMYPISRLHAPVEQRVLRVAAPRTPAARGGQRGRAAAHSRHPRTGRNYLQMPGVRGVNRRGRFVVATQRDASHRPAAELVQQVLVADVPNRGCSSAASDDGSQTTTIGQSDCDTQSRRTAAFTSRSHASWPRLPTLPQELSRGRW